jgi:integral membrane protein (TIGR01906 family)
MASQPSAQPEIRVAVPLSADGGDARSDGRATTRARVLWRFVVVLFAIAVLTLPIAWSVRFAAQSGWWWERGFDRFDVERRTGLERSEIDQAGTTIRAYFLNDEERLAVVVNTRTGASEPLFTERETLHMVDVKRLIERTYDSGWASFGFLIAFVVGVIFWRRRVGGEGAAPFLARAGFYAGVGVAAVVALLAIVAATGFDGAFRQFHLLFFTNDLWQLSNRDRLIQFFPQGFFFETTLLIGSTAIAFALVIAGSGFWYLRRFEAGLGLPAFLRGSAKG